MIGTFAAVLFFTMLKEAYEDYQRYKSDKELNNRVTHVVNSNNDTIQTKWSEVQAGQIIKVHKNEEIPADILCINAPKDVVFISTMNLDGETNLKERSLPFDKVNHIPSFRGTIICE